MSRLLVASMLCAASLALAQESALPTLPPPPPAIAPETKPMVEPVAKPTPPPPTARERRGGTVGVGYLGLTSMTPLGGSLGGLGGLAGLGLVRNQVPLLGVRWWLRGARIGLDVGAGAMMSTGGESLQFGSSPSLQLVAHLGLPIAVASTQHVIVLVAPEFRAGVSTLTSGGTNELTGSLLELAVRGGVELFFSFIGVPELSLEAAVRVGVARDAQSFSFSNPLLGRPGGSSVESFRFSTSLSGDAASIVASSLSLKYYF